MKHYLATTEQVVKNEWDKPALTDFDGDVDLTFGQMAEKIARYHLLFEAAGVKKGDKIAICGRNCASWAVSYLSIATYESVMVAILPDFAPDSVVGLVNHSDATFFLVGDNVWKGLASKGLGQKDMPALKGIICIQDFALLYSADKALEKSYKELDKEFAAKYPKGFGKDDVKYPSDNLDALALINYTSGTTSDPKGVMLSNKNISANIQFALHRIPNKPGWNVLSMLPLAHMFGMAFEFLFQVASGCHVYFLSKTPSPQVLMKAFAEVHPYMILTVPLVIEKIVQKSVFPAINKPYMKLLWYTPGIKGVIRKKVNEKLMNAFGGKLQYLIIGGAALNRDVEKCLRQIKLCYTVGYGMTECAPLIGYEDWYNFVERSCGKVVDGMEITVDSPDPEKVVGELMVKGDCVMMGYYKNEEATASIFQDGWMRTGDLGVIDKEGNIFIRGRNKSVIIGPSGQNIYPEEIEGKLNNIPGVGESVVVDRAGKLTGLVYLDREAIKDQLAAKPEEQVLEEIRIKVNKLLPAFCRLQQMEAVAKEFEKTPKRSIKRFLYK